MWRRNLVANARTLADVEVFEQRLPTSGILSGFLIRLVATNGGTSNLDNPLRLNVNSVQVRDGGRVLLDLSGREAELVSMLGSWRPPASLVSENLSVVQTWDVFVPFGMKPFDNEVGLDLSLLRNPVLRVDVDLTSVRAVSATGFLTGSAAISVIVLINDGADAPSPTTFLKSTEIKQWTTAASGDEITQAPVTGSWARLLIGAGLADSLPSAVVTDIKVSFDAGQLVVLDEPTILAAQFLATLQKVYGPFRADLLRADAATWNSGHGGLEAVQVTREVDNTTLRAAAFAAGRVTLLAEADDGTSGVPAADTTARLTHAEFWASQPYQSLIYDFAAMGMLDVSQFDRGEIVLTQGVVAGLGTIVLQEFAANQSVS